MNSSLMITFSFVSFVVLLRCSNAALAGTSGDSRLKEQTRHTTNEPQRQMEMSEICGAASNGQCGDQNGCGSQNRRKGCNRPTIGGITVKEKTKLRRTKRSENEKNTKIKLIGSDYYTIIEECVYRSKDNKMMQIYRAKNQDARNSLDIEWQSIKEKWLNNTRRAKDVVLKYSLYDDDDQYTIYGNRVIDTYILNINDARSLLARIALARDVDYRYEQLLWQDSPLFSAPPADPRTIFGSMRTQDQHKWKVWAYNSALDDGLRNFHMEFPEVTERLYRLGIIIQTEDQATLEALFAKQAALASQKRAVELDYFGHEIGSYYKSEHVDQKKRKTKRQKMKLNKTELSEQGVYYYSGIPDFVSEMLDGEIDDFETFDTMFSPWFEHLTWKGRLMFNQELDINYPYVFDQIMRQCKVVRRHGSNIKLFDMPYPAYLPSDLGTFKEVKPWLKSLSDSQKKMFKITKDDWKRNQLPNYRRFLVGRQIWKKEFFRSYLGEEKKKRRRRRG